MLEPEKLIICGKGRDHSLSGEISVQGAKNSALPLMAAALLCKGTCRLTGVPRLSDVYSACRILNSLGCPARLEGHELTVSAVQPGSCLIPEELMREMRGSFVFLGALLGRLGRCELGYPGGCELGPRPIDLHLSALKQMGVRITEKQGRLICSAPGGVKGAHISLSFPSVGATENIMLAAALAQGETVIQNAAREPEIADLAQFLDACGGRVRIDGDTVIISGVPELHGCEYNVMPDRIAAATFMAAAACAGGELTLTHIRCCDLGAVIDVFRQMGCIVSCYGDRIHISAGRPLRAVGKVRTMPYPGFPTDAQAVTMAALCTARGTSVIIENIFESRFGHVDELVRMGADIKTEGRVAVIQGVPQLHGAQVRAGDLRGGAALAAAAAGAEGTTVIEGLRYIDRGYESIEQTLMEMGVEAKRSVQ